VLLSRSMITRLSISSIFEALEIRARRVAEA
jgi:hypothetical protein